MKNKYLSVDLDFWAEHCNCKSSNFFFNKVFDLNVPITCVIEHEELLEDVKKVKNLKTLYNVDYHSDICGKKELKKDEEPTDGTWVNYVKGRSKAEYIWIMPSLGCYFDAALGVCHLNEHSDPFSIKSQCSWNSISYTDSFQNIEWNKIARVGVCVSPLFLRINSVRTTLKKLNVDIKKIEELIKEQSYFPEDRTRGVLAYV